MADIKDLFNRNSYSRVLADATLNKVGRGVESPNYVRSNVKNKLRFIPQVDFSTASNFAIYGSAESYFENSINYILYEYPYDGSAKEKIDWELSGTYLDRYIFEEEFPRTNGFVLLGKSYGTPSSSPADGYYPMPAANVEYISFKGGPHKSEVNGPLRHSFTSSNIFNTASQATSNLEMDGDKGVSIEFWLHKQDWDVGASPKQVIFDVWNSASYGEGVENEAYGRFRVEIEADTTTNKMIKRFNVELRSGSTGFSWQHPGPTTIHLSCSVLTGSWNHFALTFINSGSQMVGKLYRNGILESSIATGSSMGTITGSLLGQIGSLIRRVSGTYGKQGDGKLSASLDELRFWRTNRAADQVGRYWFTNVNGGTNTDITLVPTASTKYSYEYPIDLGLYYKFNEGIIGQTTTNNMDSKILDYSGRVTNGSWKGYNVGARFTGSAIVESSASAAEFKDPILYSIHPAVSAYVADRKEYGKTYDSQNNASVWTSFPDWIQDEDQVQGSGDLKKLTQIISSYFDTLQMQIQSLNELKDKKYISGSDKPIPFISRFLDSSGLVSADIFSKATDLEYLASRNEVQNFNSKFNEAKNLIYQNIYNNLIYLYKSKGAEKSFRNLIRCFGVDKELVRVQIYADEVKYQLLDNTDNSIVRKRYVDFYNPSRFTSVVYQQTQSNNPASRAFISSSNQVAYRGNTYEAEVFFPKNLEKGHNFYFASSQQTASLYGCHTSGSYGRFAADTAWGDPDVGNFQVSAVRPDIRADHVYFVVTGTAGGFIPKVTSSVFKDVYQNSTWNLAVSVRPKKYPLAPGVSGSVQGDYVVEFAGYNYVLDVLNNSFVVTQSLTGTQAQPFLEANKRFFVGAHRTNMTGTVLQQSNVKITSLRVWMNYLSSSVIAAHAKDKTNYGTTNPYKNAYISETSKSLGGGWGGNITSIPQMETLALNWDFDTVTSSNDVGQFIVADISSGSSASINPPQNYKDATRWGWLREVAKYQHTGLGDRFPSESTGSIDRRYVHVAKQQLPENINSSDMVSIISENDDKLFTRETRPEQYFFSFEKSMYGIISEEILKIFATIVDFNNLIGEPVNRYRQDYKDMEKLRSLYFERVKNTPNLTKFVEFFKWIDSAISTMLLQLVPGSAKFSPNLRTMVESHILERNKYRTKFPTLEMKLKDPEAGLFGINEMLYPWKRGHAPTDIALAAASNTAWQNLINTTIDIDGAAGGIYKSAGGAGVDSWASAPGIGGNSDFTIMSLFASYNKAVYVGLNTSPDTEFNVTLWQFSWWLGGGLSGDGNVVAKVGNTTVFSELSALDVTHQYRIARDKFGQKIYFQRSIDGGATFTTLYTHQSSCGIGDDVGTLYPVFYANSNYALGDVGIASANVRVGVSSIESHNCLWWHERAPACLTTPGNSIISEQRDDYRLANDFRSSSLPTLKVSGGATYEAREYVLRNFTKIYKLTVDESPEIHGGSNFPRAKTVEYAHEALKFYSNKQLEIAASSIPAVNNCKDVIVPNSKTRLEAKVTNNTDPLGYLSGKSNIFAPFSLYSSSVTTGYMSDVSTNFRSKTAIDNYHDDIYGDDKEIPVQGPFTEAHVGGRQHRHVNINTASLDTTATRPEAWDLDLELGNQKSIEFDNSDNAEYITVASSSAIPAGFADGDFSVSIWVYGTGGITTCDSVLNRGSGWQNGWGMNIGCGGGAGDSEMTFWVGKYSNFAEAAFAEDEWVHYIGTYNRSGEEFIIYRNGVAGTTQNRSGLGAIQTTSLFIGNSDPTSVSNYTWPGYINEVVLWRNTLSQEEVTAIYNDGCTLDPRYALTAGGSKVAGPVSWFRMGDDDTYPIIKNVINSAAKGTMTNMWTDDIILATPCYNSNKIAIKSRLAQEPRATMMRDEFAKRSVNVRNIQTTTGSSILGNYTYDYEMIQTSGRSINNRFFVKNDGFSPSVNASTFITGVVDFTLPDFNTGSNKYIFVERFSAPSAPEVNSRGALDVFAEEYSAYNALPWRNTIVRDPLNKWYTEHCGQFGIDPTGSEGDGTWPSEHTVNVLGYNNTIGSYHKVNRNPWYVMSGATCPYGVIEIMAGSDAGGWSAGCQQYISLYGNSRGCEGNIRYNFWFGAGCNAPQLPGHEVYVDFVGADTHAKMAQAFKEAINLNSSGLNAEVITHNSLTAIKVTPICCDCDEVFAGYSSFHGPSNEAWNLVSSSGQCGTKKYDNWFIQHPIPQRDCQYAWITASIVDNCLQCCRIGHTDIDLNWPLGATGSRQAEQLIFTSASDFGAYLGPPILYDAATRIDYGWGHTFDDAKARNRPFIPTDFAGINFSIYEPVSSSENMLGWPRETPLAKIGPGNDVVQGGPNLNQYINNTNIYWGWRGEHGVIKVDAEETFNGPQTFNALMLHRNGPYQHPSWKQIRTGDHPIARHHKKNNILSIIPHGSPGIVLTNPFGVGSGAPLTIYGDRHSLTSPNAAPHSPFEWWLDRENLPKFRLSFPFTNYIEPAITFKNKPIDSSFEILQNSIPVESRIRHSYGNNKCLFSQRGFNTASIGTLIGIGETKNDPQVYDVLRHTTTIYKLKDHKYKEVIYPRESRVTLANTRGRTKYAENDLPYSFGSNGIDRGPVLNLIGTAYTPAAGGRWVAFGSRRSPTFWGVEGRRTFWYDVPIEPITSYRLYHQAGYNRVVKGRNRRQNVLLGEFELLYNNDGATSPQTIPQITASLLNSQGFIDQFSTSIFGFGESPIYFAARVQSGSSAYYLSDTWALCSSSAIAYPESFNYDLNYAMNDCGELNSANYQTIAGYAMTSPDANRITRKPAQFELVSSSWFQPTASAYYYHFSVFNASSQDLSDPRQYFNYRSPGILRWTASRISGKKPWFNSYEDYAADIRGLGKKYTIIPEFRISEHMPLYWNDRFITHNDKFLSLDGAAITSSAHERTLAVGERHFDKQFFNDYSNSDFLKYFNALTYQDRETNLTHIKLQCNAIKKLLPYHGFYPHHRSLALASMFSQSMGTFLTGAAIIGTGTTSQNWGGKPLPPIPNEHALQIQTALQPFFAPGILYNTIKSGIAVDWAGYTGATLPITGARHASNSKLALMPGFLSGTSNHRIPFESILRPIESKAIPLSSSDGSGSLFLLSPSFQSGSNIGSRAEDLTQDINQLGRIPYCHYKRGAAGRVKASKAYQLYKKAMNNFLAEIPMFFLKGNHGNGGLKSFESLAQENVTGLRPGTTYQMDLVLQKDEDYIMMEDYYNGLDVGFLDSTAFGMLFPGEDILGRTNRWRSFNGRYFGPAVQPGHTSSQFGNDYAWGAGGGINGVGYLGDPAYAPYTPPYFYGESKLTLKYVHEGGLTNGFNWDDFFSRLQMTASNPTMDAMFDALGVGNVAYDGRTVDGKYNPVQVALSGAMAMTASINIMGRTKSFETIVNGSGHPIEFSNKTIPQQARWIISPKMETPVLDFSSSTPYGETWLTDQSGTTIHTGRGMWAGYGEISDNKQGITLSIEETVLGPQVDPLNPGIHLDVDSMVKYFFNKSGEQLTKQIGEIAPIRHISEAVVAIPYSTKAQTNASSPYARTIKFMGKNFFKIDEMIFDKYKTYQQSLKFIEQNPGLSPVAVVGSSERPSVSIPKMLNLMDKYVFPPELDFLRAPNQSWAAWQKPFAMYIFEFNHTLDSEDLSDIWQGLMPKIGTTAEESDPNVDGNVFEHPLGVEEFFGGQKLPDDIRWLVFKVKKRAATDYFKMTPNSGDNELSDNFNKLSGRILEAPFSYNWPYDYFSLVELAEIEVEEELTLRQAPPPHVNISAPSGDRGRGTQ